MIIDAQASRRGGPQPQGRDRRQGRGGPRPEEKEPANGAIAPADMPPVDVASGSTVKAVAEALGIPTAQIIKTLMGLGEMATITQSLSDDAIELVAEEVERKVRIVHAEEEADVEPVFEDDPADLRPRAPVVTVMGHVDHGKTSLLDAIRSTEVTAGEAGGITQHIGAYQVQHSGREITFLDTPGHEAFTAMRARGAKITDVAVIVVAADDGVMPQTVEAIDHARAAEVPFMVAVNKIDKAGANPDRVKQELSQRDVIPSDWGGTHEFVEVSALERTGLETLLETVLLVADADAEPTANPNADASGTVVESRLDPGRGPVSTLLVQRGTLHVGDVLLVGDSFGRVRAMADANGNTIAAAGPSVPVEVLGMDRVPDAGEKFRVVDNERTARQLAGERGHRLGPRSWPTAARCRSTTCSRASARAGSRSSTSSSRATCRARSAPWSTRSARSSRPRCACRSSAPASARSPSPTSCWPPPRRRSSSASTCARGRRPAPWPSARASTSAPTASSTG